MLQGGRPGGLGGKPPKQPAPWGTTPATPQNEWATLDWGGVAKAWQPTSAVKPGAPTETSAAKPGAPTATSAGPVSFRKGGTAAGVVGAGINLPGTAGKAQGQGAVAPPPTETTGGGSNWQPPGGEMSESFRGGGKKWTAIELFRSGQRINKAFHDPKPAGTGTLRNVVPYVGSKSLLMQFLFEGVTVPLLHQTDIFWSGCSFVREDPGDYANFMKITYREFRVWIRKIDLSKNPIRVRCSCPAFYFFVGYWNWENSALFGTKPKRYIRKTLDRPEVNKGHFPGCDKHVVAAIELAQRQGWILPSPRLR